MLTTPNSVPAQIWPSGKFNKLFILTIDEGTATLVPSTLLIIPIEGYCLVEYVLLNIRPFSPCSTPFVGEPQSVIALTVGFKFFGVSETT